MNLSNQRTNGFTLLELMIVISLMVSFAILTIPYTMSFYQSRAVEEQSRIMVNVLERAQSHAITAKEDSDWGVRFFHETNEYLFFKGERYDIRDSDYDQTFKTAQGVVTEGVIEIVFRKNTGEPKIFTE